MEKWLCRAAMTYGYIAVFSGNWLYLLVIWHFYRLERAFVYLEDKKNV